MDEKRIHSEKTLWSFWDGPDPMHLVSKCRKSWQKYLPHDWKIVVLDSETVTTHSDYQNFIVPNNFATLIPAHKSDVVRLNVLYRYGGLYMDATVMLHDDVWRLLSQYRDRPLLAFQLPHRPNFVENWLLYAPRANAATIKLWLDDFVLRLESSTAAERKNAPGARKKRCIAPAIRLTSKRTSPIAVWSNPTRCFETCTTAPNFRSIRFSNLRAC